MENRNYKDSVFVDLFARDITAKENFVSLYNALHETNLDYKTTEVKPIMIEQVLYKKYYNDIAMLIVFIMSGTMPDYRKTRIFDRKF